MGVPENRTVPSLALCPWDSTFSTGTGGARRRRGLLTLLTFQAPFPLTAPSSCLSASQMAFWNRSGAKRSQNKGREGLPWVRSASSVRGWVLGGPFLLPSQDCQLISLHLLFYLPWVCFLTWQNEVGTRDVRKVSLKRSPHLLI